MKLLKVQNEQIRKVLSILGKIVYLNTYLKLRFLLILRSISNCLELIKAVSD